MGSRTWCKLYRVQRKDLCAFPQKGLAFPILAVDGLVETAAASDEAHVLVVDAAIDHLVETIVTASTEAAR